VWLVPPESEPHPKSGAAPLDTLAAYLKAEAVDGPLDLTWKGWALDVRVRSAGDPVYLEVPGVAAKTAWARARNLEPATVVLTRFPTGWHVTWHQGLGVNQPWRDLGWLGDGPDHVD
jgi:hypothetical protein